jgi:Zn-dependent peptidase ImmA (M78 family)
LATTGKNYPRSGEEVERLCDMFAAEILMPREAFIQALPPELTLATILELANTFKTSWWASAIRCAKFKRVSVFEADRRQVHWSSGVIRKGPVSMLDGELQHIIKSATEGASGQQEVYLTVGNVVRRWALDFAPVGDRARVLLRQLA